MGVVKTRLIVIQTLNFGRSLFFKESRENWHIIESSRRTMNSMLNGLQSLEVSCEEKENSELLENGPIAGN